MENFIKTYGHLSDEYQQWIEKENNRSMDKWLELHPKYPRPKEVLQSLKEFGLEHNNK